MSSLPHIDSNAPKVPEYCLSSANNTPPVSVAEGYERWAPSYDHFPNPLLAREERYLTPLLGNVSKKRVLDLACGTGRWLEKLVMQGNPSGAGIDCSTAMLRVAKNKTVISGRVVAGDCASLPFRSAVFDLAICSFALGHICDLRSVVYELARVMKFRADVYVSDLHPEAYAQGWRTSFRDGRSTCQIETLPRAAEEIVRVFHAAGFECLTHVPLCLGKAEKSLFQRAGKSHLFAKACRVPAVLVCHFRRRALR